MSADLAVFLRARLDEDERYLNSNRHHLWTKRPLREVEAKRAIIAEHTPDEGSVWCGTGEEWLGQGCATLSLLAAVYSDHLDYRPEWKP